MDKKGIIGGMMVTYVATVAIVIILIVFVIGASFIREFDGVADGVRVYDDKEVGLGDIGDYMLNYSKVVGVRYYVGLGLSLKDALVETEARVSEVKSEKEAEYWEDLSDKYPDISR
jgi:hypothetical protein